MASKKLFKKIVLGITFCILLQNIVAPVIPIIAVHTASAQTVNINSVETAAESSEVIHPSNYTVCVFNSISKGTITGCIVQALYWAVFTPLQAIAELAGRFLDYFVMFSISSRTYKDLTFIETGWGFVRDITNIIFIFGLLLAAFSLVLGTNLKANPRQLIINVVIFGLLINFSLFFTRVIVDAGNIMATVFYNNVGATDAIGKPIIGEKGEKNIALAIIHNSNPQGIWSEHKGMLRDQTFVLATLLGAIALNIGFIILFFSVGYLFLGRIVGLAIQMIFAPLAFASKVFPFPMARFSFSTWLKDTFQIAFMAPVFMFFLYLVLQLQKVQNVMKFSDTGDTSIILINVLLPYALTWGFLMFAKKTTKSMSGEIAGEVSGFLTKATGMLGGAALTLGSAGLTAGVGAAGAGLAAQTAGKTNWAARGLNTIGKKAATSNFDFRSSALGKRIQTGIKDTGGKLNLGTPGKKYAGGYVGLQEAAIKRQVQKAEEFAKIAPNEKVSKDLIAAQNMLEQANKTKDADYDRYEKRDKQLADLLLDAREDLKLAKDTGNQAAIKEAEAKVAQGKRLKKENNNSLRGTQKYKEIFNAAANVDKAKKAVSKEQKVRKNKYAEALEKFGLIGTTASLSMSNTSLDEAIRKIKGDPESKEKLQKPIQVNVNINQTGGGTGQGGARNTQYNQTTTQGTQNINTNQNPNQNQNTNTNTGTNINNNPPSTNQNNNNNGGSNNNYGGGINNPNGPIIPPPTQ